MTSGYSPEDINLLADTFIENGQHAEALDWLHELLRICDKSSATRRIEILRKIYDCRIGLGQVYKALKTAVVISKLCPLDPEPYLLVAQCANSLTTEAYSNIAIQLLDEGISGVNQQSFLPADLCRLQRAKADLQTRLSRDPLQRLPLDILIRVFHFINFSSRV